MPVLLNKKNYREFLKRLKKKRPSKLSIKLGLDFFSLPRFDLILRKIADFCIEQDMDFKIYDIPPCFLLGYRIYLIFSEKKIFVHPGECISCQFFEKCPGIIKNHSSILGPLIKPIRRGFTDLEKCMFKILNAENEISTERVLKLAKGIKICASCTSEGEVFRVADRLIEGGLIKKEFKKGKYVWSLV